MQEAPGPLKKTPLNGLFREMGARLVDFAGWEMPVHFSSVLEEHHAVRKAAGLFDVSHMGEIEVRGPGALALVQRLTCNDASRLAPGQAQYSVLTTETGTFVDDILVYRRGPDAFLLVVNAGNTDKDFAWIAARAGGELEVANDSARWAQLAIQGPRAEAILQDCTRLDLRSIRSYRFVEGEVRGARALFRALLEAGKGRGILPCGLGARDTLRLEARMLLYGNDVDETTSVLEAGLSGIVRLEK